MNRAQFEHVIRAASEIVGGEMVVIGSQAILASFPDAPADLLRSMEADVYPRAATTPEGLIDGAIGDGSYFHDSFGYYAHEVGPETVIGPAGWEDRLVRLEAVARVGSQRPSVAWCLEPHDLVLAKLAAGRGRDWEFAAEAIRAQLVDPTTLRKRAALMPTVVRDAVRARLDGAISRGMSTG